LHWQQWRLGSRPLDLVAAAVLSGAASMLDARAPRAGARTGAEAAK